MAGLQEIFFVFKFKVKITRIDFKPIGVGRDFLLPFLSRKKGEQTNNYRTTLLAPTTLKRIFTQDKIKSHSLTNLVRMNRP